MKLFRKIVFILLVFSFATGYAKEDPLFKAFIKDVHQDAAKLGISEQTLNKYLDVLTLPITKKPPRVIQLRKHQAQAVLTFNEYKQRLMPRGKILRGRRLYHRHYQLLQQIYKRYQVQPQFLIVLWGLESDFGSDMGHFPLIKSLAILAYHHHRSKFYRLQLIDALKILDGKHVIPQMKLSAFDGGMGQPQFEPSSYVTYAVDFDGDGFKNIWTSIPDSLASIANFLHRNNWNGNQGWGIRVKLPKNFNYKLTGRKNWQPISKWQALGVLQFNGQALPKIKGKTAILLPNGKKGRAYLVYPNFTVLLQWNDTTFESLSVGLFSDEIIKQ